MKAIRIHGPNDVRHEEVPIPKLGPDDVLIKIRASGICGTDLELVDCSMFYITQGLAKLPLTPGHEWAGVVVELGDNAKEFSIGDRVTGECTVGCGNCAYCRQGWYNQCPNRTETGILNRDGSFAEYIVFPRFSLHKCNSMDFEDAAFIEPTGIALGVTKITNVCPSDYVAIMGPGPIGLFAVQTAKAYGARKVILIGTNDSRLAIGKKVGADVTVNVRTEDLVEKVKNATEGHMIDVAIEAVGKPPVWDDILSILAPRGRVGLTGLFAGQKCLVDFDFLVINNITIFGSLGSPNVWDEAISLCERGVVKPKPLISHRIKLEDFVHGTEIMRKRLENVMKVIVKFDD